MTKTKPGTPYTADDLMPGGRAFKVVLRYVSRDKQQRHIQGVYVSPHGTTVATDGHQLIGVLIMPKRWPNPPSRGVVRLRRAKVTA